MSSDSFEDIVRVWGESAPYWEKHRATIEEMFAPVTEALIEEAGIKTGHSVLDVAAGSGEPSLTIAKRMGPTVRLTATDPVRGMIEAAQREASRRGLTNITFNTCAAESLPFEEGSFDAVVCRFGAMFFSDPLPAMRSMLRVTRSGGRAAFAVWRNPVINPFFQVVTDVISRYIAPAPEDPDAPGAFRFAEPGKLARLLERAGASDVRESVLEFRIEGPIGLDEFWTLRTEMSDTLRQRIAQLSADDVSAANQEVEAAARKFFLNGRMSFPAQVILVSGKRN